MHPPNDVTKPLLYKPRFMKLLLLSKFLAFVLLPIVAANSHAQNPPVQTTSTQTTATQAEVEKKWEFGIGAGSLVGPDYRGSDEYRDYSAAIPYVVYRGKYIRSDRDGVRGNFLRTETYEFTLSASAVITPDSDKSTLREGMPELGSIIEFGPSFNVRLSGDKPNQGWQLHLPWRAVFAIDDDESGYMGHIFQPQLVYRDTWSEWNLNYRVGVSFADDKYHAHYYTVAPEYATENRPAFAAAGGYSGWHNQISLTRKLDIFDKQTRLALFVRYDNLDGTEINDSPLVVTHSAWRGGIAAIWVFK
jgi:MipA family protein